MGIIYQSLPIGEVGGVQWNFSIVFHSQTVPGLSYVQHDMHHSIFYSIY